MSFAGRPRAVAAAILLAASCVAATAQGLLAPTQHNQATRELEARPMVFYRAKGAPDSCGPGCSEWIAAIGKIERNTAQQFENFLALIGSQKLPVFFHSPGGNMGDAFKIGRILRQQRMTVGVGRTTPAKCRVFSVDDSACQQLVKSGEAVNSRLDQGAGRCFSACVYAFIGGSTRQLARGTLLGVHSSRLDPKIAATVLKDKQLKDIRFEVSSVLRQYIVAMGVSSELEALAAKVSSERMYILTPEEIARFGLKTGGSYQTSWISFEERRRRPVLLKTLTETHPSGTSLTTSIMITCGQASDRALVSYRRELLSGQAPV